MAKIESNGKEVYDTETSPPSRYFDAVATLLTTQFAEINGEPVTWQRVRVGVINNKGLTGFLHYRLVDR